MLGRMYNFFSNNAEGESKQQSNNMMDMCRNMMSIFFNSESNKSTSTEVDPEIEVCFNEWLKMVEDEVLLYVNETKSIDSLDIALKLKIPVNCTKYIIKKLISERRIDL
ncbi:hypothetical protein [Pseudobacteroides cellulosolvens]|uniref:Uncharacterized protein n=1 Tax=Pseudobacteroides cellulosolvens ATCC 35603 = DSM 2933 TaxID=398512 RepID=A0A0L6JWR9_9FIRM|nr:hypothetical protein [Pseudobacteroides cellulosolvens]KNY30288.1 hypothetical protein Bccel_5568 [Pseudobacteroides cellulosolvens ATCC 35603 = DSM 2933]